MEAITIPGVVRRKAELAGAAAWLEELDGIIAALAVEWDLQLDRQLLGGTEAIVLDVMRADGVPAVLKVAVPTSGTGIRSEIEALRVAGGHGCVRLLRDDAGRSAMLLERLGPSMAALQIPWHRRHLLLADASRRFWCPVDPGIFKDGAAKAGELHAYIEATWTEVDRPCSRASIDHALRCASSRSEGFREARCLLAHGDVQGSNALQDGDTFSLIDPDGLFIEPEYDLGVIMREDPVELLAHDPRDWATRLARQTWLTAEAVWEWGVVEITSTGLLCTRVDVQPLGRQLLRAAEHCQAVANS